MGTTDSKEGLSREESAPGTSRQKPAPAARSPFQPQHEDLADADWSKLSGGRESLLIYASMLLELFDNTSNLKHLPFPRRIAMNESIRRASSSNNSSPPLEAHRTLTEIVMEGLLTCDSLSADDKNLIIMDGMIEQRWDRVFQKYTVDRKEKKSLGLDEFYSYRKMILVVLKSSYKMQQLLPEDSRLRVKQLILKTDSQAQLDDLLQKILERTCGVDIQMKIMNDMTAGRYYRLVWPDRLDCEHFQEGVSSDGVVDHDSKPRAIETASTVAYGSILLPDDLSHRQDCCPICLDPIQTPALELSCHHVFCSRCISDWIVQQQNSSEKHNRSESVLTNGNKESGGWHCPVCRQVHDTN